MLRPRFILGLAGQIVLTNHYIVHIRWRPIWFTRPLSFILFRWCPQHSQYWLRWKITTRNTALFQQLSLHESARSWYLAFFDSWTSSVLSSQDTVNSTIITYFGYADHRYISDRRFESVTSLRKWYVRSYVYPLWQVLGMTIYDIVCVQQEGEIFWKLPFCQICRKGQHVVHGSEKKTHLNWLIFPQHFQDSFLSSLFHFILFYWACNWTFLSTLLHVWFLPAP